MSLTARQIEARDLRAGGLTVTQVAGRMGITERRAGALLRRVREMEEGRENQPEAVNAILDTMGLDRADTIWLKTKEASVQWRRPKGERDPEAWVEAIRSGLADVRAEPMPRASQAANGRMAVFPLADLHIGLLCDEEEVGEAWDIQRLMDTLRAMIEELVDETPAADVALVGQLGDLLHADDKRGVTPISGHHLDTAKFFRALRAAVAAMKMVIETMRRKFPRVIYRGCRGNHDENVHYAVTLALAEHYADAPDVEVVTDAEDAYVKEFGTNFVLLHHGDRMRAEATHQYATAHHAAAWGRTSYRISISGHVHHLQVKSVGGMRCESVGTIVPGDIYARSHGFIGWRELVSIIFDEVKGERFRARVGVA